MTTLVIILLILAVGGYIIYRSIATRIKNNRMTWVVPFGLLDDLMPEAEAIMRTKGFSKETYGKVGVCVDFAIAWKDVISKLLKPHRPSKETEWIKIFSFARDLREDGSSPGGHSVVAIKTSIGIVYVDTYPIGGGYYRTLSSTERASGKYM